MNDNFSKSDELKEFLDLAGITQDVIQGEMPQFIKNTQDYSNEPSGTFEGSIVDMPENAESYISALSFRVLEDDKLAVNGSGSGTKKPSAVKDINLIKVENKYYVRFLYPTEIERHKPIHSDTILNIESVSGEFVLVDVVNF